MMRGYHDRANPLGCWGAAMGFTLIEVMIAMVVLSIGILGVAQLQFLSFQNNRDALYRNQATVIAEDLLDRVRGNPTALTAGAYNALSFTAASSTPASIDCSGSSGCTAAELATNDVYEWARNFVTGMPGYTASLPGGIGAGDIDSVDASGACPGQIKYDVGVSWSQPDGTVARVGLSACY